MDLSESISGSDDFLASLIQEGKKLRRGKLKIFFGMCPGVGKTDTMLQRARIEKSKGIDVIIGCVETHGCQETEILSREFQMIQMKGGESGTACQSEIDLDAIITRNPETVLIGELAHINDPNCRHRRRYHDVLELLEHGINVFTTLNVQQLESRSEIVAQITGIEISETIPDEIFENADEVELVDLSPDELIKRYSEGKGCWRKGSEIADRKFYRKGNITALREMALRVIAENVDRQLHDYLKEQNIRGPWKSGAHLLVAIDYHEKSTRLLRWAKNLANFMGANIQAIYVEASRKLSRNEQVQLNENISLAKQLGIVVRIVTNYDTVKAIVDYAFKENATHIIVGKPQSNKILPRLRPNNFLSRLIRDSGNIDVYIFGSDIEKDDRYNRKNFVPSFTSTLKEYLSAFLLVLFTSVGLYLVKDYIGYQIVSFGLLFLVSILAIFLGSGPILLAAAASAVIWDYFFIPPQFNLHIEKPVDVLMLVMFFIIAIVNGILTSRVRRQEQKIRIREERTQALYQLTKELSSSTGIKEVSRIASKYVKKYFSLDSAIILKTRFNKIGFSPEEGNEIKLSENDFAVAEWVYKNSVPAGRFSETMSSEAYTFYPLAGNSGNMGVIAVALENVFTQGEEQFWEAFLSQISGKYEREFLRNAAKDTYVLAESEKLYKTLFNSISHELRIPVATILGASDTLISQDYPEATRQELYSEMSIAAVRLNRLIENLLNMSRIESGHIKPRFDWCDVNDLVNKVSESLQIELRNYQLITIIPAEMPLVWIDFGLMEQVLHNLILNATQHTPEGTNIRLKISCEGGYLNIMVMDRGPGFPASELEFVFNKFYRGKEAKAGGTGLGLSIVKGFVNAHDGTIIAENRANGGARFEIRIPVKTADIDLDKK
ncbi:MAG: ATP-binding protein [Prolixibacteraceae bacterium]|jgi:two-component system, OmpR family, sensor histidine kinase KdpD